MTPAYTVKLGLTIQKTSIGAQKIDGLSLETYSMTSASFSLQDSLGRVWFFEETFLLADTSIKVVLGMLFLALNNANILFGTEELTWRTYTVVEALFTTSRVEFIDKKEFTKVALNGKSETFVIYVIVLDIDQSFSSSSDSCFVVGQGPYQNSGQIF